jgi:hypothetical protein
MTLFQTITLRRSLAVSTTFIFLATASASMLGAQASRSLGTGIVLLGGAAQYDLSGTGTTGVISLRLDHMPKRWLVTEASLGYLHPPMQFGGRETLLIPEGQLQVQLPFNYVMPYLGIGGGWVFAHGDGRSERTGTASVATGLRVVLPNAPISLQAELRVRGIGKSFSGSTAEWTGGLRWRL